MSKVQVRIESALERLLPPAAVAPRRLHEAMRYVVLGGGKRIRPLLAFAAGGGGGGGGASRRAQNLRFAPPSFHPAAPSDARPPRSRQPAGRRGNAACPTGVNAPIRP